MNSVIVRIFLAALSLVAVAATWWWLGQPEQFARAPLNLNGRVQCVSYAPFRDGQTPLVLETQVSAKQIAEDLAQLVKITPCIRTYSIDNGLDQIPALAEAAGLKVIQGLWLGSNRTRNRHQIETVVSLTKAYPDTITSVVVGNEVLLRGEMTGTELAATIREVKQRVSVPVTYADVWEFWLRHREVSDAVDFITIHILPYWEDFPVRAGNAVRHVDAIRRQIALAFPGKEILIGETGWPSAGRMREGALPSRINQARIISGILDLAARENFSVNLIEAYDQPWKRQLEGTVGGYWGLIDAVTRHFKYKGRIISNHPDWLAGMGGGLAFAIALLGFGLLGSRRAPSRSLLRWTAVTAIAGTGGVMIGLSIEKMLIETLEVGGGIRSGTLIAAASVMSFAAVYAVQSGEAVPTFYGVLAARWRKSFKTAAGLFTIGTVIAAVIATMTALGFVFDPRYLDFPYAALTMAVTPLVALRIHNGRNGGDDRMAERLFAAVLGLSSVFVFVNEGVKNWQAVWMCVCLALFAITLWPVQTGQKPE